MLTLGNIAFALLAIAYIGSSILVAWLRTRG